MQKLSPLTVFFSSFSSLYQYIYPEGNMSLDICSLMHLHDFNLIVKPSPYFPCPSRMYLKMVIWLNFRGSLEATLIITDVGFSLLILM